MCVDPAARTPIGVGGIFILVVKSKPILLDSYHNPATVMPSIFTITNDHYGQDLSDVFNTWTEEKDMCLVSTDGHLFWTSSRILNMCSSFLREVFSGAGSTKDIGISVPADLETIQSVVEIINNEDDKKETYSQELCDFLLVLGMKDLAACLELIDKGQACDDVFTNGFRKEETNHELSSSVLTEEDTKYAMLQSNTDEFVTENAEKETENDDLDKVSFEVEINSEKRYSKLYIKLEASESEETNHYECTICGSNHATKSGLKQHTQRIHSDKIYSCDSCEYTTTRPTKLKTHKRTKHEGIRYACDKCDFTCSYSNYLKVHIENKHEGIKYPCNFCDYKSTDKVYIRRHILSQHEGFTVPCPVEECQYVAKSKASLKEHNWRKHEEAVYFYCEECTYKTVKKSSLKHHTLVDHEGVRFECDSCDYKARSKLNLKTHTESVHEKIKHPCDICGYKASTKNFLYVHKKSKHGDERYYCDQCKYVSSCELYLRQHKKRSCTGS